MNNTMNNIEKLIQMATIEHMYAMLQKMKNDNHLKCNFTDESDFTDESEFTDESKKRQDNHTDLMDIRRDIDSYCTKAENSDKEIRSKISELNCKLNAFSDKMVHLITELAEIKSNVNNNKCLCQKQHLTSYPSQEEAHIKLKIEEKPSQEATSSIHSLNAEKEEEDEEEEEEEEEDEEEEEEEEEEVQVEEIEEVDDVGTEVEEVQVEKEEQVEEEEESEEEVGTEVDEVQVEEEEVDESEEEVDESEEEEEVFEIEIDDVTYFATHEENGILYEMTSDGDVGKKMGIIKDGEPIFN